MAERMAELRALDGQLDWNDVRYFLAVTRRPTLARLAAALGVDQTTVSRRLASLGARVRVSLFARTSGTFQPSRAGRSVLEAAERMEEAALELRPRASNRSRKLGARTRVVEPMDALDAAGRLSMGPPWDRLYIRQVAARPLHGAALPRCVRLVVSSGRRRSKRVDVPR